MPDNVLILCTGNSCRSQMAEVIWRELSGGAWVCFSAGSRPSGYVHPLAIKAIEEFGHSSTGLASKTIDDVPLSNMTLIVTVCDNAKNDCPVVLADVENMHWPFDDPADATGTDEEKMAVFRRVRDEIRARISAYLNERSEGAGNV